MSDPDRVTGELFPVLAEKGWSARMVSVQGVSELRQEITQRLESGQFDEGFYSQRLSSLDFKMPDSLPGVRSLIVVAVPSPQSQAVFTWRGKKSAFIVPPTYNGYDSTEKRVVDLVTGILDRGGYHAAAARLPLKLLAVRSGLGRYGRNNICYVPGMGSFLQLVAAYTDLPCHGESWGELRMMDRCRDCYACRMNCPTGAIPSDRFLLRAERCIVFHNEKAGKIPFPDWLDPTWHNCLVGCLHCQRVCPEDRNFLGWIEGREEFSEEETDLILKGTPLDQLPEATAGKLKRLDLVDYLDSLPRNLGVLLGH